jgi:hypothetical protein
MNAPLPEVRFRLLRANGACMVRPAGIRGADVSDIFQEVDEELRAERTAKLLKKYAGLLIGAAVAVVAASGAWQAWQWHMAKENARVGLIFLTALDAAAGPEGDGRNKAALELAQVEREGNAGYRTMARLRDAALKADSGDLAGAEVLWNQVADDAATDPLVRDAATLFAVEHQIDTGDPAALAARLQPLAAADHPWHALAQEAEALLELRQGHEDAARTLLKQLAGDTTAPDGVRGRANGLLAQLGG